MTNLRRTAGQWGAAVTDTAVIPLDASTEAQEIIDYAHHEIHAGSRFLYSETVDLASGANRDILIVTPNTTKWAHLSLPLRIGSNKQTTVTLYEDTTTSADGTAVSELNHNRNSGVAATVVLTHSPTVTVLGTILIQEQFGVAGGFFTDDVGGVAGGGRDELILKQNTKYLLRITNNDGSDPADINIFLDWYEHTDKH